jgi:MFS family permease
MPYFKQTFGSSIDGTYQLSTATDSLITSILSAGTLFGALAASTIGDALGRRLGIIAYICVFIVLASSFLFPCFTHPTAFGRFAETHSHILCGSGDANRWAHHAVVRCR